MMLNRCLLIAPSRDGFDFPRGMLSIASFLKKNNIETQALIIPYHLPEAKSLFRQRTRLALESKIKDFKPDFIGVSNTFTRNYYICIDILKICKEISPEIKTAIGGQHVTFLDTSVLGESRVVDFVVRGEGEWTMLELLKVLPKREKLQDVAGISFRNGKQIIRSPQRSLGDLANLPPIDFSMLSGDFVKNALICSFLVRGCNFKCSFCSDINFWRHKTRAHPIDQVLDEIEILFRKYGKLAIRIEDSMLDMRCKYFFDFCNAFHKRKIKLSASSIFSIYSRIDTISDNGLRLLKNIGIDTLGIGIENGSEKVLKMMNKGIRVRQIISNLRKIQRYKFKVGSNWVIGHPGDNPKEAQKTLDFMKFLFDKELISDALVWKFLPFPGCNFFHQPKKYDIEILCYDWSKWTHDTNEYLCQLKDFPAEKIQKFFEKAKTIARAYAIADSYRESKLTSQT